MRDLSSQILKWFYQNAVKPILFLFDPELVHKWFVWLGENLAAFSFLRKTLFFFYGTPEKTPHTIVDGMRFHSPVLLAAGFDYNGKLPEALSSMGFAGEEVGSVTARKCHGNEPPRMKRLINSQSILVYKGLKNDGVDAIIERLKTKRIPENFVLGISIAKTNDEKSVELDAGIEDYAYSLRRLSEERIGQFYTINVSCPNVHGGEDFASPERLKLLLEVLANIDRGHRPSYVKLPINKDWEEFEKMLKIVKEQGFQGVVIGNLNKNYDDIRDQTERPPKYRGGVSGSACQKLSNELIAKTRQLYPENFTIIGCGGVLTALDAMEKLRLGADLVQLITGMIFNGPHLMREISISYQQYAIDSIYLDNPAAKAFQNKYREKSGALSDRR